MLLVSNKDLKVLLRECSCKKCVKIIQKVKRLLMKKEKRSNISA